MADAVARRVPLRRPCVDALALVVERAAGDPRPYLERPWVEFARARGIAGLLDLSEGLWAEARSGVVAMDDGRYLNRVSDALIAMLQAIIWSSLPGDCWSRSGAAHRERTAACWLMGAWPCEQPRTTPKTLAWPAVFGMNDSERMIAMQNAVLHMAQAVSDRMRKAGIHPPAIEVVA